MSLGEDDRIEMTNLHKTETGLAGVLFISSKIARHGPRVKYFLRKGSDGESYSVSISPEPRVLASSMSRRDLDKTAPQVLAWVRLNHEAMLRFWHEGEDYSFLEFNAFVAGLKKV